MFVLLLKESEDRPNVPALRLPPVGLAAVEKPKDDPAQPTPPNPGPPANPAGGGVESDTRVRRETEN